MIYGSSAMAWKKVTPTQLEYNAWPNMCKSSQFLTIPPDAVRPRISEHEHKVLWASGGWHYCTGLLKVRRAELMPQTPDFRAYVEDALKDINVSFDKIDKKEPWSAEMAVTAARAHRLLNEPDEAERYLKFARSKHPSYAPGYTATAMLSFDRKDYAAAIEVLQAGMEGAGDSGELHYFLGLAYFYQGDVDTAKQHAESARALGYPLTGLARKIARHEQSAVTAAE
jgi:tetratricopeptide (TPR) repeat protein